VDVLHRGRQGSADGPGPEGSEDSDSNLVVRAAPGVAAMFTGLKEDRSRAVLDLGPGNGSHLRLYARFARWVRFVDLLTDAPHGKALRAALEAVPPNPQRSYDLVLCWDLFDRLRPGERPLLVERLVQLTAQNARLFLIVDVSGETTAPPLRFTLLGPDRVCEEPWGRPRRTQLPILPEEVGPLLTPFEVVYALTPNPRVREYVAMKGGGKVVVRRSKLSRARASSSGRPRGTGSGKR
jgi:hypothetical protein